MKSVTEFFINKLAKGNDSMAALTAEGKTAEEIEQALSESFKLEGDKLKYFMNCMTVATENPEKLSRILVVTLNEGESVPPKAVQIEEHYYIPEFQKAALAPVLKKPEKGAAKKQGKRKDGPKSSPWGISPEEEAAKKASAKKANEKK